MNKQLLEHINSIVSPNPAKPPEFTLEKITPGMKNIELKFIILKVIEQRKTKQNRSITKFLIADSTGSAFLNVYDELGTIIQPLDVLYISGAYANLYKGIMNIHQGKVGLLFKIDEFFFQFIIGENFSLKQWEQTF